MDVVKILGERVELIKAELEKVKAKIATLTEQLQAEQANFHRINGHLNEAAFLLTEAQKDNAPAASQEGEGNGEANNQEAEQPA